jgi:CubicO group peptidase (beta-lactamase class C family)
MGAHTLADLIPLFLAKPLQFEPGTKWKFCQSGINTAARVVEVVSGVSFSWRRLGAYGAALEFQQ